MPKIMSVSLALFFAFFATHAVAGDDNDCVSIPEDAGYPYTGQTHCCNRVESNLPAGAHNAKYGDVIPWNQYKGTVRKCIGGTFHDDKWSDPFVSVDGERINDLASEKQVAWYQHFSKDKWRDPTCINNGFINGGCVFTNILRDNDEIYLCFSENTYQGYIDKETEYLKTFYDKDTIEIYKDTKTRIETYAINLGDLTLREFKTCVPDENRWVSTIVCTYEKEDWKDYRNFYTLDMEASGYELTTIDYNGSDYVCFIHKNYKDIFSKKQNDTDTSSSKEEPVGESEESSSETESVIQYGYQQCSSNSDCTREKLSAFLNGNPYLHSTDWYCIEQTSGNHVCAAKACEDEYEIKTINGNPQGYCIKKTAPVAAAGQTPPAGQQQKQSDSNSDKSTVTSEQKQQSSDAERIKQLTANVDSAYASLQTLTKNLSVWKNTEGNFNTARLVSDSAAGVVLGTVGGVVTATLVKKNQIKKGFESIQCTVGGQTIGGYGDQIKIGR